MKKSVKKPNPSTVPGEITKPQDWWMTLENASFCFFPEKKDWRKRMIFTMYNFFEDPSTLVLEEYPAAFRIPLSSWDQWCREYDDLKEAKANIKRNLATRRKKGVMTFKLQPQATFKDMHLYDPEWVEVDQYHADLKKNEDPQTKNVVERIVYVNGHVMKEEPNDL